MMINSIRTAAVVAAVVLIAFSACSGGGSKSIKSPSTSGVSTSSASSTSVDSVPTTTAAAPTPGLPGPVGGGVPSGVIPVSVTFDSATEGFVLADAPCGSPPCTSVLRTRDAGRSWVGISAPRAAISTSGVSGQPVGGGVAALRFASAVDGWAYGPALYATHDGGASWHAVTLPGSVIDLEASGGQAFAVLNHCPASAPDCSSPLPATLWHSSVAGDQWAPVPGVTGVGGVSGPSIFLRGASGWVILIGSDAVTELFFTSDGVTWTRINNPCTGNTQGLSSVAAVASAVGFLCIGQGASGHEDKQLLVSTDGGHSTRLAGTPPSLGDGGILAALSPTTWALANSSAASFIYRSTDSGHTWTTPVEFNDGGEGFSDFGFTTASQGVAIHGPRHDSAQLIISRDGGTTWNPITF